MNEGQLAYSNADPVRKLNEQQQAILVIAARLTAYPASDFHEELQELGAFAGETLPVGVSRMAVTAAIRELGGLSLREVREAYVGAFDLKDRTGLYLTAHELGDSRKRGVALLEMQAFLQACGFSPAGDELPDYMPMLYELAASGEVEEAMLGPLLERLAFATERIRLHLPDDNPFKPIFEALMQEVFVAPSEEAMREQEARREKPDMDPMPYPLMYQ